MTAKTVYVCDACGHADGLLCFDKCCECGRETCGWCGVVKDGKVRCRECVTKHGHVPNKQDKTESWPLAGRIIKCKESFIECGGNPDIVQMSPSVYVELCAEMEIPDDGVLKEFEGMRVTVPRNVPRGHICIKEDMRISAIRHTNNLAIASPSVCEGLHED